MAGESKKIDYKSAGKLPSLEVPPDLTQPTRDDRYAVPDTGSKGSATFSTYTGERTGQARTADTAAVLPQVDKMRIERSGTQRWLVVSGIAPDKLIPVLHYDGNPLTARYITSEIGERARALGLVPGRPAIAAD